MVAYRDGVDYMDGLGCWDPQTYRHITRLLEVGPMASLNPNWRLLEVGPMASLNPNWRLLEVGPMASLNPNWRLLEVGPMEIGRAHV